MNVGCVGFSMHRREAGPEDREAGPVERGTEPGKGEGTRGPGLVPSDGRFQEGRREAPGSGETGRRELGCAHTF